jgi:hypothetical protein
VNVTDFHIEDKLLCHMDHLCVPTSEPTRMIWEAHYSWMEGHFGVEKIVVILHKHFCWPKIQHDVNNYIISFIACVIAKPNIKKKGLYTPLTSPKKPRESILMDYMSGVPSTKKGNDYIFVVIDRFSKMVILIVARRTSHKQILPRSS